MSNQPVKISEATRALLLRLQQAELTESACYRAIANRQKEGDNKSILLRLSEDEYRHYTVWKGYTGVEMKPNRLTVLFRTIIALALGFTFAIKRMESNESAAQGVYDRLAEEIPEARLIEQDENEHEQLLIGMLDEERLQYVGSMVLGLNDALVELTGTLAGLTLAIQNTRIIALSGLITGISATLSMAASEFLSARSEGRKDALKSALYTGAAYVVTVAALVLPYLLFDEAHYLYALATMIAIVVLVILVFNYYIATAKGLPFRKRFLEMAGISLGVAALSFVVGLLAKQLLGIDI